MKGERDSVYVNLMYGRLLQIVSSITIHSFLSLSNRYSFFYLKKYYSSSVIRMPIISAYKNDKKTEKGPHQQVASHYL